MLTSLPMHALRLTAARDGQALAATYVAIVRELAGSADVTLFEVYLPLDATSGTRTLHAGETIVRRFDEVPGQVTPRLPNDSHGVLECLLRRSALELPARGDAAARLLLPIIGGGNPQRVLVIETPAAVPELRVALLQLTELFANQSHLMDQRERDALTGLLNRQALNQRFMHMQAAAHAAQHWLWLAVLDLDHFKRINDGHGHLIGDEVLLHTARLMESVFRFTDGLFRFGGEEFVVLMVSDEPGAHCALERFRATVARHAFPRVGTVTLSTGFTRVEPGMLPPAAIDIADQALYEAKRAGRNRVVRGTGSAGCTLTGEVEMF
ncbi:MAG: GGDEF domain-containing protein [Gammaproteobacteria bacterium]